MAHKLPDHNPAKPQPKRTWLAGKFQIPNKDVYFGRISNAFGE
jgi:hypothetical protein